MTLYEATRKTKLERAHELIEALEADISATHFDSLKPSEALKNTPYYQRYRVEAIKRLSLDDITLLENTWLQWSSRFDPAGSWIEAIYVRLGVPVGMH